MSKYLEQKVSVSAESLPNNVATIIDTMSIVQQIKGAQKTFGDIAKLTINTMMVEATWAKQIDMLFEVYQNNSINNIKR